MSSSGTSSYFTVSLQDSLSVLSHKWSCVEGPCGCLAGLFQGSQCPHPSEALADPKALTEDQFRQRIDLLAKIPLFKRLPPSQCPILARQLRGRAWEEGSLLLEDGQVLEEFMLVAEGWADVQVLDPGSGDPSSVQTLCPGDYFGEKALESGNGKIWHSPARVVAGPGLVTLSMTPQEFEDFGLRSHLSFPRRRALSRCVLKKGGSLEMEDKDEEQKRFIADALRANVNLRSLVNLQEEAIQKMCDAAERQEVKAGTEVVQRGEYGGMFYIVESGSFQLRHDGGGEGGCGGALIPSETLLRRQRKEGFLQRLAHGPSSSPLAMSPESSLGMALSRSMTAGATPTCRQLQKVVSTESFCSVRSASPQGEGSGGSGSDAADALPTLLSMENLVAHKGTQDCFVQGVPARGPFLKRGSSLNLLRAKSSRDDVEGMGSPSAALGASREEGLGSMGAALGAGEVLGTRRRGDCFGELALLFHAPRTSTAVALQDSAVWCVSQAQFRRIMRGRQQQERIGSTLRHLDKVELLHGLLRLEKEELARNFLTAVFRKGDCLIRQGEKQDVWYVVTQGECAMTHHSDLADGAERELARLRPPQHFGERALLRSVGSEFSVHASSDEDVQCLVLDGPTFHELAGHLSAEVLRRAAEDDLSEFAKYKANRAAPTLQGFLSQIKREPDSEGQPARSPVCSSPTDGPTPAASPSAGSILDPCAAERALVREGILGKGAFGLVTLERDPATGQRFALKTMSKRHIVESCLEASVRYERDIMTMIDSSFIIRLHATAQDANYVYFLFEPLLGGELYQRMCRQPSRFRSPKVYTFVLACLTSALEHLHERNVVFRDLKPENALLDAHGYVKLCDLGFAKFVMGKTMTLCGTPEYMAPEVLKHVGYDRMVDWWAVGVVAYEMISGTTPFSPDEDEDVNPQVIFGNIARAEKRGIDMPDDIQPSLEHFIHKLLQFSPASRLGSSGTSEVKGHPLFGSTDFEALAELRLKPEYIPRCKTQAELTKSLQKKKNWMHPVTEELYGRNPFAAPEFDF